MTASTIDLQRWFLEPVRDPVTKNWKGEVRIWGKAPSVAGRKKWWRSSTIRARVAPNKLKTRYGTIVHLQGKLCASYAKRIQMTDESVQLFLNGFPTTWRRFLRDAFQQPSLSQPNLNTTTQRRTRSSNPSILQNPPVTDSLKKQSTPQPQKRPRRKRVAFADCQPKHNDTQQEKSIQNTPQTRSRSKSRIAEEKPTKTQPKKGKQSEWTSEQRNAFEVQRNRVNADDPNYWETVARGVNGKTGKECQALWESSWESPMKTNAKKVNTKETGQTSQATKDTTPLVIKRVMAASKQKRSRATAKYRTDVRRMVDTIARDTADDALEPRIRTPKMDSVEKAKVQSTVNANAPGLLDGTPGSEVRRKRAQAEKDGVLPTPEIIARGKSFGLTEADHYVSLFKRRLGVGSTSAVVPALKKGSGNASKSQTQKNTKKKLPSRKPQKKDEDSEDDSEDDGDIFF